MMQGWRKTPLSVSQDITQERFGVVVWIECVLVMLMEDKAFGRTPGEAKVKVATRRRQWICASDGNSIILEKGHFSVDKSNLCVYSRPHMQTRQFVGRRRVTAHHSNYDLSPFEQLRERNRY